MRDTICSENCSLIGLALGFLHWAGRVVDLAEPHLAPSGKGAQEHLVPRSGSVGEALAPRGGSVESMLFPTPRGVGLSICPRSCEEEEGLAFGGVLFGGVSTRCDMALVTF